MNNPYYDEKELISVIREDLSLFLPLLEATAPFYAEQIGTPASGRKVDKDYVLSMFRCDCTTMAYGITGIDGVYSPDEIRVADLIFDGFYNAIPELKPMKSPITGNDNPFFGLLSSPRGDIRAAQLSLVIQNCVTDGNPPFTLRPFLSALKANSNSNSKSCDDLDHYISLLGTIMLVLANADNDVKKIETDIFRIIINNAVKYINENSTFGYKISDEVISLFNELAGEQVF